MSVEPMQNPISPPVIPLSKLKEPLPSVPPPAPSSSLVKSKKKERRMELMGLEPGDPRSTFHLVKLGLKNTLSLGPNLLKKYWWLVIAIFVIWWALGTFNAYQLSQQFPRLTPLWFFLEKLVLVLVFLSAAYNNFIAKALYAAVIIRVGLPLFSRIRREGLSKVTADFKKLLPGLKANVEEIKPLAFYILVAFSGFGAILTNFLTRNNRVDKIAVSLALAMALMKALSDGPKSLPFMTGRVVMKDLFVMMLKPSPVKNPHIYLAISGLTLGLLCSLPFALLASKISDNLGYIVGILALLGSMILFFLKKPLADKKDVMG